MVRLRETKLWKKAKVHYIDTNNFMVYIKTEDIYLDIAKYVEVKSDTSNHELDRPLPNGKNKKVIGLMKIMKIMKNFAALKPKT